MVNARSGKSAHAGLLINGSQQVLFDPAGTFTHPDLPRAGDVHYGMTPRFVDYYERYHARFDYFVEAQKVPVTRAEADQILADAQAHGKSMKMTCALAMAEVLHPVPRFADAPVERLPGSASRLLRGSARRRGPLCHRVRRRQEQRLGAQRRRRAAEPAAEPAGNASHRAAVAMRPRDPYLTASGSREPRCTIRSCPKARRGTAARAGDCSGAGASPPSSRPCPRSSPATASPSATSSTPSTAAPMAR